MSRNTKPVNIFAGTVPAKLSLLALALAAFVSVAQGVRNGLRIVDFHWESAALFLRGENPYAWFFAGKPFCGVCVDATQAPSTIAFLLPFGFLDVDTANYIWLACNLGFTAIFLAFVSRLWFVGRPRLFAVFACLFLMSVCWREGMGCGQHTMFSLAFFMAAIWSLHRKHPWWVIGLLLAPAMFKYTVMVPLVFYFVLRKAWKSLILCAAIHVVLTLLLGMWTATNPITLVWQSVQVGQSLYKFGGVADLAALAAFFGASSVGGLAIFGYIFFGCILVGMVAIGKKRESSDELYWLSFFAVIANVICCHREYDFVSLGFVLAMLMVEWDRIPLGLRITGVVCIFSEFFYERIAFQFGWPGFVPICFTTHLLLLIALIRHLCCNSSPMAIPTKALNHEQ